MINGLGFSEVLIVLAIILLFFGSKELPYFIREMAKLMGKARRYSEKIRKEMNDVTRSLDIPTDSYSDSVKQKKSEMRSTFIAARKSLTDKEREEKSKTVCRHLVESIEFGKARSIMVYMHTCGEVMTTGIIDEIFNSGKRLILPYCRNKASELGIAEVKDIDDDLQEGEFGIKEPIRPLRDNFFKSDLQLVICPGVAFNGYGERLGRGKGYYDSFLKDVKGRVPIFGLAYKCQITEEKLPFDYHDISVDQVITEEGLLIKDPNTPNVKV